MKTLLCKLLGGHKGPTIECGRSADRVCLMCGTIFIPQTHTIMKRAPWKTSGVKHMSDGTVLRLQLNKATGIRRVQRLHRFPFLGWRDLPEELSLLEALMFNSPTRLAIREGTDLTLEVCTNNVLLPHYQFLPLTDPRSKRYIVGLYATVEDGSYWDEDTKRWKPLDEFFRQPNPEIQRCRTKSESWPLRRARLEKVALALLLLLALMVGVISAL